jgi:hypothetical protein
MLHFIIYIYIYHNNVTFLLSVITPYFCITNLGMPCIVVSKKIKKICRHAAVLKLGMTDKFNKINQRCFTSFSRKYKIIPC